MNCDEVMEAMQRDLDGDLTAEERQRMQIHLLNCPDCVSLYERLRRLSSQLENLPKVEPPFSLVDALLPRLEAMPLPTAKKVWRRKAMGRRLLLWTGGTVVAALLGVMVVLADMHKGQFAAPKGDGALEAEQGRVGQAGTAPQSDVAPPSAAAVRVSPEERLGKPSDGRGQAPDPAPRRMASHDASRPPASPPGATRAAVPSTPEASTGGGTVGDPAAPAEPGRATESVLPPQEEPGTDRAFTLAVPDGPDNPFANPGFPPGVDEKDASVAPRLSSDGQWRAAVVREGEAKRVVVHDATGAERFRSHALSPDARVTLQWEGNALVYDVVTAQDGRETAERWRVDVAAGTEERLSKRSQPYRGPGAAPGAVPRTGG